MQPDLTQPAGNAGRAARTGTTGSFAPLDFAASQAPALAPDTDDPPVVRFLQALLTEACLRGASDLHFEPFETFYRIRLRVDGVLQEIALPPPELRDKLTTRIKVLARLDIAEKRLPQDGRMKLAIALPASDAALASRRERTVDFRVSTLPTLFGEKLVLRLLPSFADRRHLDELGYAPRQKAQLLDAIHRPSGMVLVTGPTGSGKTVSLYACLDLLNGGRLNVMTAEDPVEIQMPGVNQVNINEKSGLTFATALRAFLRQDPDVIMVGEIRDAQTADIAIQAAQTGHLVFSTLHTADAPATLTRLASMGVPPFHIASGVLLITAQRLARRLCACKRPGDIAPVTLLAAGFDARDLDGSWVPWLPAGCRDCNGSGYRGRCGIHQVMPVTDAIREIVLARGSAPDVARQASREGVLSLRAAGLLKVREGVTSLDEVLCATNP